MKRAYEFNRATLREEHFFNVPVLMTAIHNTKDFPFGETTGNFHPATAKAMAETYKTKNLTAIENCLTKLATYIERANPSFLTKGKQTWDPMSKKSITSAKAYDRIIYYFSKKMEVFNL